MKYISLQPKKNQKNRYRTQLPTPFILLGDFNAHSPI